MEKTKIQITSSSDTLCECDDERKLRGSWKIMSKSPQIAIQLYTFRLSFFCVLILLACLFIRMAKCFHVLFFCVVLYLHGFRLKIICISLFFFPSHLFACSCLLLTHSLTLLFFFSMHTVLGIYFKKKKNYSSGFRVMYICRVVDRTCIKKKSIVSSISNMLITSNTSKWRSHDFTSPQIYMK